MNTYEISYQKEKKLCKIIISTHDIKKEKLPPNILMIKKTNQSFFSMTSTKKLNSEEISAAFFELNVMLQAKLSLYESLEILENGSKNRLLIEIISNMKKSLKNGTAIYLGLMSYEKYLGDMVIAFFKIAHENGNMNTCVYTLSILLKQIDENKKNITQKLRYPAVLLSCLLMSLFTIFNFVIPQFEFIFEQYNADLPFATITLLNTKNFLVNYFWIMLVFFLFFFILIMYKYRNNNLFSYKVDRFIIQHLPFLASLLFYMYLHRFFLCIKILLQANYKFQTCLVNASILLKNKYLLDRISHINKAIQSGESIYDAFFDAALFNDLTLRLISTGEKSNELLLSVNEIEKIYADKLNEKIKLFSSLIEPIFIITIMLLIIWVILAVLVPLWGMGEVINV